MLGIIWKACLFAYEIYSIFKKLTAIQNQLKCQHTLTFW